MKNVFELLKKQAFERPDKIAFSDPGKDITFGDLYCLSKKLATLFIKDEKLRLKPEEGVAFFMEKSVDALGVMFGTVLAGGFYSFIDIRQPSERMIKILDVLDPPVIVTDTENAPLILEGLKEDGKRFENRIVLIDSLLEKAGAEEIDEKYIEQRSLGAYDLMPLYVNFTSGSTGIPKGVAVGHRSVMDFIEEFVRVFGICEKDVIANQAPFDFDVSVKDIYSGLYTGARVCLIPREYFSNPVKLMDYICDNKASVIIWAVSAMCFVSVMNGLEYRNPDTLKQIMFSGEVMPVKHLNKWRSFIPGARYVNLYGPTEITCNCTYFILDREYDKTDVIPAGIPFSNEKVFLLDENDSLVERTMWGKEGEICVGGSCLALGYYKDKAKTDEVFVQNPLNKRFYERIYRTGDIGQYDEEGNLIYVSRKDFQIKHMGQRIELADIEAGAMALDGVSRSCVIYDTKRKKIVLFYTGDIEKEELTKGLLLKLPPFMLPGKTIKLEEMPLNKNGKIDRSALNAMV